MFEEVITRMLESVDEKTAHGDIYPKFSGKGYQAHKIEAKNFHGIRKTSLGKRIAFVDGGNAEIIGSANFSLNLIRVCYVIYKNNKKIASKKIEILAFVKTTNEENEIHYRTEFFGINNSMKMDELSFSSLDNTLMHGANRAEISSVANAARRFAELRMASLVADSRLADIILLDGNLQCTLTNESRYMDELHDSCGKNNVILAALSKTSSLFADNGDLLSAVLSRLSSLSSWFYHPIADITNPGHMADIHFVKFNDKSNHVFRLEIFSMQKAEAAQAISEIAPNCRDPVFLGYPYGLVEADRIARISSQEKESLKTMILVKLRSRNIDKYLNASNAHEILDKISF